MNKLYVIARAQLNTAYQFVQGGHAVAQWLIENGNKDWNNEYLIYLNTYTLDFYMETLDENKISYSVFREPDMQGCITAIACYCDGELFQDLNLIRV